MSQNTVSSSEPSVNRTLDLRSIKHIGIAWLVLIEIWSFRLARIFQFCEIYGIWDCRPFSVFNTLTGYRPYSHSEKNMICKLKLHFYRFSWKNLRALHSLEDLELLFKIFYTFVCKKVTDKYMEILKKASRGNLSTGTPPNLSRTILCSVPLVYNWYFVQSSRFKEIIRH